MSNSSEPQQTTVKRRRNDDDEENGDDDDVEVVCSLKELVDSELQTEDLVGAVLGASDATNCSYSEGYVYRQALYGCATCLKELKKEKKKRLTTNELRNKENDEEQQDTHDNAEADDDDTAYLHGLCLACTYTCHANHELYELYTKRNFRCDCGNSKFKSEVTGQLVNACKLEANKELFNTQNKYNHNFKGLYCTCKRPYGTSGTSEAVTATTTSSSAMATTSNDMNTSTSDEDDLLQCSICEDWFHTTHLPGYADLALSSSNDSELICHLCMKKYAFLRLYQTDLRMSKSTETGQSTTATHQADADVDIEKSPTECKSSKSASSCLLERRKAVCASDESNSKNDVTAGLFDAEWRSTLCQCASCLSMYNTNGLDFLLDPTDKMSYYEEKGKKKLAEDEAQLFNEQLNKLNKISQVEFLQNMNDFKEELSEFLSSFARNGEVLKRENVSKFFEELNEKKKRKLDIYKYNYYCK